MISLGLDCGTQSTKCVALDLESGQILASAQEAYDFVAGLPPGHLEQNPADWIAAADAAVLRVLQELGPRKEEVRCLAVSGQQHGLVVLDENDAVIRPAKLWCDTSTAAECAELTETLGGLSGAVAATGNAMLPGYTAPKIRWIKNHEPSHYRRIRHVLLPHDFLNFWLTGEKRMEFGDASGTAILDVRTRQWSPAVLQALGSEVADWLPPLGSSKDVAGLVRGELLQKWNLTGPVAVGAGGGDNMMGAIGTGNVNEGVVTVSLGTSGTLFACSASPIVDDLGEVAAFCDSTDQWLPLVCTMNVTLVTELIRELFAQDHAAFAQAAAAVPPGSDGLLLLPYLTGERTPNLPHARGTWDGISTNNLTPGHLARSAIEGVTLGLGHGLQRFRQLGLNPTEIRLTGGGSNSPVWRQICADIFDVPTVCLRSGEGAALGAAIQAFWTWAREEGADSSLQDYTDRLVEIDESSRCQPSAEAAAVYRETARRATQLRQVLHPA
jgi:xylulokinase